VSSWTDFPTEEWNGTTWHIGPEGICCTDEVKDEKDQPTPTGEADTGDDFGAARDLDHTNANVQNNCKNYVKCLQEKYGYAGMRYDMVKGYGGQYTKIYNDYANVQYSVGEYWDASYDAVKAWIDATGKTSAAFDFPCKYAINEAFKTNDMTKLVWKANGTTDQPAGMIHFGYSQYAVTFVENHDTARDDSKFSAGEQLVPAANAFILMSPGTPCVFLRHYMSHKAEIQKLINVRNTVGLHNNSKVTVLKSTNGCYMAEVEGANGKLVVKIGPDMVSPEGYADTDIVASGNNYCVWTNVNVNHDTPDTPDIPVVDPEDAVVVYFNNSSEAHWAAPHVHYWGGTSASTWPGPAMEQAGPTTWRYACPKGTTGIVFNDNGVSQTGDLAAEHLHVYGKDGNSYSVLPEKMYIIGDLEVSGGVWDPMKGVEMTSDVDGIYTVKGVKFVEPAKVSTVSRAGEVAHSYFSIATKLATKPGDTDGDKWKEVNSSVRFGPKTNNEEITENSPLTLYRYNPGADDVAGTTSWMIAPGTYDLTVNMATNRVEYDDPITTGIATVESGEMTPPIYYNLQGVRVMHPTSGNIYIVVRGSRVTKELVR